MDSFLVPIRTVFVNPVTYMWLDFEKTDWIVTLGLFHFIGPANGYTCTPHVHSAITGHGWLVCFSRASFANPVNSSLRQWNPWRALGGRHGCEIHPRDRETSINTIQACLGLWLELLGPIASPNSPNRFNLPPASHPPPLPTPLPLTCPPPIMCHQWYYSDFEKSWSKSNSVS